MNWRRRPHLRPYAYGSTAFCCKMTILEAALAVEGAQIRPAAVAHIQLCGSINGEALWVSPVNICTWLSDCSTCVIA